MHFSTAAVTLIGLILCTEAATISKDARCGSNGKGATCLNSQWGSCCSQYGWCGSTDTYCGMKCQPGFGKCNNVVSTSQRSSTVVRPTQTSTRSPVASSTQPVSKNARCGAGFGGQTCQGSKWGDCCSKYSYCGSTDDYCRPSSCQAGYGQCDPDPSKSSSSSISSSSSSSSTGISSSSTTLSPTVSPSSTSSSSSLASIVSLSSIVETMTSSSAASSVPLASVTSLSTTSSFSQSSTVTQTSSVVLPPSSSASSSDISSSVVFSSAAASSSDVSSNIVSTSLLLTPSSTSITSNIITPSDTPSISSAPSSTLSPTSSEAPTPIPLPPAFDQIKNPGFELGEGSSGRVPLPGWSTTGLAYGIRNPLTAHGGQTYAVMVYPDNGDPYTSISQNLDGLDITRSYTLTYYYTPYYFSNVLSCKLTVLLGARLIDTHSFTPPFQNNQVNWKGPIKTAPLTLSSSAQTLTFRYQCIPSGVAGQNPQVSFFLDDLSFNVV